MRHGGRAPSVRGPTVILARGRVRSRTPGSRLAAGLDHPPGDDGLGHRTHVVVAPAARAPSAVTATTTGKIRRVRSGPPVALSSSAASYSASTAARTAVGQVSAGLVPLLQRGPGEHRPGSDGVVVVLLVPAAGDVVGEDPARAASGAGIASGRRRTTSSTPANSGTTASPCMAAPRLPRIIVASRFALPSRESRTPSIFS